MSAPSVLLVTRHAPYGASLARSALDAALAAAAFDRPPTLLFLGDGVLQLLPGQDASGIGTRSHRRVLDSLPLYGIDTLYVDSQALAGHDLTAADLPPGARPVDDAAIRALLAGHDHILGF
ncbi:sulfurtransferase complex subunit TusC [Parahaliea mediterranea]|uniref:Sulfurtransferase complex subunit TusC n=1 Tax=Parahaliea mediterranea TaxID=651086 RepID=A0A939IJK1_9GAMM|nr:sulfurtransferase complex subunit TusC [Parahaliea mediterranea]MBN7797744.1 sulfurtransferase complex subunit TusC [Parahaliea mediterranea]